MTGINLSIISDFSPVNSAKHLWEYNSPIDAIKSSNPSLKQISDVLGHEVAISLIGSWLIMINEIVNVKRALPDVAIEVISFFILKDFDDLKIDEYAMIILSIAKADYGSMYQSLSSEYIFSALRKHRAIKNNLLNKEENESKILNLYEYHKLLGQKIDTLESVKRLRRSLGKS